MGADACVCTDGCVGECGMGACVRACVRMGACVRYCACVRASVRADGFVRADVCGWLGACRCVRMVGCVPGVCGWVGA